ELRAFLVEFPAVLLQLAALALQLVAQVDELVLAGRRRRGGAGLQFLDLLVQRADDFRLLFEQALVLALPLLPAGVAPGPAFLQGALLLCRRGPQSGVLAPQHLQLGPRGLASVFRVGARRGRLPFWAGLFVPELGGGEHAPQGGDAVLRGGVLPGGRRSV